MTVRCTRSLYLAAFTAAACAFVGILPDLSHAASSTPVGAPTQLLPQSRAKDTPPPETLPASPGLSSDVMAPNPSVSGGTVEEAPSSNPTETVIGGIRSDDLAPLVLQADGVGTMDGLGPDLWRGTTRGLISAYLRRLPVPSGSLIVHDLADKLLLTSAAPPPVTSGATPESLIDLRLNALLAMGDVEGYVALALALPAGNDDVSTRARVQADFLAGDDGAACTEVSAPDRVASLKGEFWNRAMTICDVIAGRTAAVQLALDVQSEQNPNDDSTYVALLRAATAGRGSVANLSDVGPLEATLLRLSKADVAPAALREASALALRTIALNDNASPVRLEAAERAEALGAIPSDKLAEIYAAVAFKKDELANALTVAASDSSARGRALLYQAEEGQQVPAAKAEVIKAAFAAGKNAASAQAERLYAKQIAAMDPAPELTWFAVDAARALYAVGNVARAEDWRMLVARDPNGAMPLAGLWLLSTIANAPVGSQMAMADASGGAVSNPMLLKPLDTVGFASWLGTFEEADRPDRGAGALTLLDSLGVSIPPEAWAPYLDAAAAAGHPSPLLSSLSRAAEGDRSGETVLLGLASLGSGNAQKWSLDTVAAFESALARIHLGSDARALATEAALAAGF
jgi:hypothetical protein